MSARTRPAVTSTSSQPSSASGGSGRDRVRAVVIAFFFARSACTSAASLVLFASGGFQGCAKVRERERFEAERDAMASGGYSDAAEQEGGSQDRCPLAVDFGHPT